MRVFLLLFFMALHGFAESSISKISLAITMICRDEEVNFRSNLKLWLGVVDYFVFMIDSRTTDQSVLAIEEILKGQAEYEIVPYEFEGFGPARTDSLETVWQYFPQATHVIIADPDWRPEVLSMNKAELDLDHDVFRFLAYDRNGQTTRRMDWMLRNREGVYIYIYYMCIYIYIYICI
jgi:hypothetical protein